MRIRLFVVAAILVLVPVAFAQQAGKVACDRACLEKYVDRYLDAMLAHDPSLTLFARDRKFTENGVRLPLGKEGLWYGMSGKGTYKNIRFYLFVRVATGDRITHLFPVYQPSPQYFHHVFGVTQVQQLERQTGRS